MFRLSKKRDIIYFWSIKLFFEFDILFINTKIKFWNYFAIKKKKKNLNKLQN